jgi:hypothetical protein
MKKTGIRWKYEVDLNDEFKGVDGGCLIGVILMKISIQFTIEMLEEFIYNRRHLSVFHMTEDIMKEIQELKQYLDEKV